MKDSISLKILQPLKNTITLQKPLLSNSITEDRDQFLKCYIKQNTLR